MTIILPALHCSYTRVVQTLTSSSISWRQLYYFVVAPHPGPSSVTLKNKAKTRRERLMLQTNMLQCCLSSAVVGSFDPVSLFTEFIFCPSPLSATSGCQAWFYSTCYLRFAADDYDPNNLDVFQHLTNNSVSKYYEGPKKDGS